MQYIANQLEMKEIDAYTIQRIGIPSIVLMERAAMTAVAVMMEDVGKNDRILAVCGTGNNGGDGVAMARLLWMNGFDVDVFLLGEEDKATDETKTQIRIAKNVGVRFIEHAKIEEYTVWIDAIFGIGLSKDVTGVFADAVERMNRARLGKGRRIYAVDIPSGVHAGTGRILNTAVRADLTITFGVGKLGLTLYPGCEYGGEIVVADIGFPNESIKAAGLHAFIYEKGDVRRLLPIRTRNSNKGSYGKALVVAGSKNMSGACYLSAKAAYRSGAGLVKIFTTEENREVLQTQLPEAILSTYESEGDAKELETALKREVSWATVIVIGPGMGTSLSTERMLDVVLQHAKVPIIVDADAINVLAKRKEVTLNGNVILTPHIKEMARLCHCEVADVVTDTLAMAKRWMEGRDCTLVLKDSRTLVLKGDWTYVNVSGNHGMATGGLGDVLTGVIAGLVAGGKEPYEAAALGTYIHGLAGDYVRDEKNPYSLMAGDVAEALSHVMKGNV